MITSLRKSGKRTKRQYHPWEPVTRLLFFLPLVIVHLLFYIPYWLSRRSSYIPGNPPPNKTKLFKGKEMKTKSFSLTSRDYFIVLSMLYASVSLAMNIFCMKPLSWGTNVVFSDGGQTISWIVFLISNVIVEVWGEKESIKVISFAALTTFFLLIIGRLLVMVPVLPEYAEQNNAFILIFSNGPRTIISSIIAFWIGGFINIKIIAVMKRTVKRDRKTAFFIRASLSTLIGQLVDNALFMTLAFAPFGISLYEMMWKDIFSSVIIGTVIELLIESCMVPFVTIPLSKHISQLKKREEKR